MIRPYQATDLAELLYVWEAASAVAHPFLSTDFMAAERENIPKLYLPTAETWVCQSEAQVVGFIALIGNEVGAIFVHPNVQRQGIGQRLMDQAQQLRGVMEVEVFQANAIGRAFYARYGFEQIDESIHEPTGQQVLRLKYSPPGE